MPCIFPQKNVISEKLDQHSRNFPQGENSSWKWSQGSLSMSVCHLKKEWVLRINCLLLLRQHATEVAWLANARLRVEVAWYLPLRCRCRCCCHLSEFIKGRWIEGEHFCRLSSIYLRKQVAHLSREVQSCSLRKPLTSGFFPGSGRSYC